MPIPKPNKGEEKDAFINRCMGAMNSEFPDQKQRSAVCYSQWKEQVKPMIIENKKLNFSSQFSVVTEGLEEKVDQNKVKIKGTMLKSSVNRNGHLYKMEEIKNATFSGNVITVNHSDSVTDVIGEFSPVITEDGVDYEGWIQNTPYHPGIVEMARAGLLKHVSVEAIAKKMKQEEDVTSIEGIDFTGLGIVKTPGFVEASFAIAEAFEEIKADTGDVSPSEAQRGEKMVEKTTEEKLLEQVNEMKESFEAEKKAIREELTKAQEEIKALKEKPDTKGVITENKPKYDFELMKENKSGKVNYFMKDARKTNGEWVY